VSIKGACTQGDDGLAATAGSLKARTQWILSGPVVPYSPYIPLALLRIHYLSRFIIIFSGTVEYTGRRIFTWLIWGGTIDGEFEAGFVIFGS
jgi:hypothetical protein